MPNSDFGLFGFSINSLTVNIPLEDFLIVGTPYLLEFFTFLHNNITLASGFFFCRVY